MPNETITGLEQFVNLINQTGGIPLRVTTETAVAWEQYVPTLILGVLGSLFVIWWLYMSMVNASVQDISTKSALRKVKRINGKRPVMMIKHTQYGMFGGSMINQETLNRVIKGMLKFKGKDFDLILHTPGGEIFSSMYLSRLIKSYPGKIRVIIPVHAMSGGTLLALSADEVLMGENACLGPIDPQIGNLFKFGSARSWDYIKKFKGKKTEDSSLAFEFMGKQYTRSLYKQVDLLLGDKINPLTRKKFLKFLTSGDVEHSYNLTPGILNSEFGLSIKVIPSNIQNILLKVIVSSTGEGVHWL